MPRQRWGNHVVKLQVTEKQQALEDDFRLVFFFGGGTWHDEIRMQDRKAERGKAGPRL